jgi:predicted O-linked N-acetylglucosamine transferase (SPINDLY family)
VPIRSLGNLDAARAVRERGIDILINLNGYFGEQRNGVFALRAAPVQVNYLGFPGTIGAPYLDYIIADATVIPPGADAYFSEQVVRLPHCYQPNDSSRTVAATPADRAAANLPTDAFVFCCLNNAYKIVPALFDTWMRVLKRVPNSVLLLYGDSADLAANLRHEAQLRSVDGQRILFAPPLPHEEHLRRLQLCDLFLDTWPYNAHTTGSDALWAGLPVLTCMGRTFAGRVGASMLRAVNLPELITADPASYESMAVRLASEPGVLQALRARLAHGRVEGTLYDTVRYTGQLEAAYRQMMRLARDGKPAQSFEVAGLDLVD